MDSVQKQMKSFVRVSYLDLEKPHWRLQTERLEMASVFGRLTDAQLQQEWLALKESVGETLQVEGRAIASVVKHLALLKAEMERRGLKL